MSTDAGPGIRYDYRALSSARVHKVGGQVWVFPTKSEDERPWSANKGYDESEGRYYPYNSNVSHSRQVKAGDLAVIRVGDHVAGWHCSILSRIGTTRNPEAAQRILGH